MAAKNKRDVPSNSGMQGRASQRRDELIEEAHTLRRSGKIREAKGVEKRAGQVDQLLGALESDARTTPHRGLNESHAEGAPEARGTRACASTGSERAAVSPGGTCVPGCRAAAEIPAPRQTARRGS